MAEEDCAAGGAVGVSAVSQEVLKAALITVALCVEFVKLLMPWTHAKPILCLFASDCDEHVYVTSMETLCGEHQINVIKVDDKKPG